MTAATEQLHTAGEIERLQDDFGNQYLETCAGVAIATVETKNAGLAPGEGEANARRLALCWNCHDDLVKAVEMLLIGNEYKTIMGVTGWHIKKMPSEGALNAARAAIAKAKEQP